MDYRELLEKYNLLLSENSRLIKENGRLKALLGITKHKPSENAMLKSTTEKSILEGELIPKQAIEALQGKRIDFGELIKLS